ncbi:hypothetical protein VKS41_006245 [Umbelopsis sp. WA50703]
MSDPYPSEKVDLEADQANEDAKVIRFDDVEAHPRQKAQDHALTRTASMSSQNIIAYRTLSITVSEHEGKRGAIPIKKKGFWRQKKDAIQEIAFTNFHKQNVDELFQQFSSSETLGLDSNQVSKRLAQNGKNKISPPPSNWGRKLFNYFFGGFCSLLWFASIICWISWKPLGDPNPAPVNLALAVILMFVVFLQAIFNAWQDWSTNKVMNGINNMLPTHTLVLRDGKQTTINALDLVTGDVVYIKMGNKVPADVRLIQVSDDLRFDRSILTGESEPIAGSVDATDPNFLETQNIAMMGTHCVNGSATGIVIGTGDNTMMGKIARLSAANSNQRTLLQIEILRFVLIIAGLSISVGIICLITWAAWLRVDFPTYLTLPNALIDVISVIVAFVPEGMPVAVTLCLTLIANRMAKNNVLCKVLTTVETLGSVNVICCDKTGTITCNKMFATNASIADQLLTAKECVDITNSNGQSPILSAVRQLHLAATLCTNASFDSSTIEYPVAQRKVNGDATDSAVLVFAENMEDTTKTKSQFEKVFEIPFNSKNKWMLTLSRPKSEKTAEALEIGLTTDDYIIYTKGAPDVLFSRCSSVMLPDGSIDVFSDTRQKQIVELQTQWATEGKRVLALTRRIIKKEDIPHNITPGTNQFGKYVNDENKNLTIVGLLAIVDPPRDESAHTIAVCRKAGIRFFMVTGDFPATAAAIAKQVGIFTCKNVDTIKAIDPLKDIKTIPQYNKEEPDVRSLLLTGSDILTLNDTMWEQVCQYEEIVFSRTSPEQKLFIVKELQKRDNIVAMTGDGVNDAPSLKAADVGVAMGGGSDVATEAGDMILLDKFSSIIVAIENGRLVFDNLKKVILYLLPAGSWSELWPVLVNIFLGSPQTLSSFLMIVICVLTDLLPSLALMMEGAESDLLTRKPRFPKKDRLVNLKLLTQAYLITGVMEMLSSMIMFYLYLSQQGIPFSKVMLSFDKYNSPDGYLGLDASTIIEITNVGQSIYFINLVICQWFNALSVRTRTRSILQSNPLWGPTRNLYLFAAFCGSLCIALIILYVPVFNSVLGTSPIPVQFWFIPFGFGFAILLVDETRKLIVRTYPKSIIARIAW